MTSVAPSPFKMPRASGKASTVKGNGMASRQLTIFGEAFGDQVKDKSVLQFCTPQNEIGQVKHIQFKGRGRGKQAPWSAVRTLLKTTSMAREYGTVGRGGSWTNSLENTDNVGLIKVKKTLENICVIELFSKDSASSLSVVNDVDSEDAESYEYTVYDQEIIAGVYGSFSVNDKHLTSFGFILNKVSNE